MHSPIVTILTTAESLACAGIHYEYVSHKQMPVGCILIWEYRHESCKVNMSTNKLEKLCCGNFGKHILRSILKSEYKKKEKTHTQNTRKK